MVRKILLIEALVLLVLILAVEFWLPGFVENQLNRREPHAPWVISSEAKALHDSILVADLHADPLLWKRDWLTRSDRGHTDLPRLQEGGVGLQILTAVTKSPSGQNYESNEADSDTITYLAMAQLWPIATWNSPFERAIYQGEKLADWDARAGDAFRIVRDREDLAELIADRERGKRVVGGIFGIEGGHALDGDLANLDRLDILGLRVIGLTHFFDNRLGGSLHGVSGEGLTAFGREVVREAERRRMIIDVAHASPRMVEEVLQLSDRPVILSHGGFKGVCDSARNLEDALMIELAESGALIGVGFWEGAICDHSPKGVVAAIRYGIDLLGVDHIALGSDYDGATGVFFDAAELAILTQTMLDAGFREEEIRKVMGGNAVNFFLAQLP
jgi:microsomal dipeptidase-like Zn-dependent dipeptidase